MRMMTAAAQHPAECAKYRDQRHDQPNARQNIFAHASARQAVGQRIKYRVIDTVAGEVITGVEGNIQNNEQAQHRERGGEPPGITTGF